MESAKCDYNYKIILLGDFGVGKTTFFEKYSHKVSSRSNNDSFIVFFIKNYKIIEQDDTKIKIQLWDTSSIERFRKILPGSHYRNSDGALIFYDINNRKSYERVINWWNDLSINIPFALPCILIGNKCDLGNKREVSYEDGSKLAQKLGIFFMEMSALMKLNVNKASSVLISYIIREHMYNN